MFSQCAKLDAVGLILVEEKGKLKYNYIEMAETTKSPTMERVPDSQSRDTGFESLCHRFEAREF